MSSNLLFISLIAKALKHSDREGALGEAFAHIKRMGEEDGQWQGFQQFERFMEKAALLDADASRRFEASSEALAHGLSIELISGDLDGEEADRQAAVDLLLSRPQWKAIHESLLDQFNDECPFSVSRSQIWIEKDGQALAEIAIGGAGIPKFIENITPGRYAMKLVSGRVVWGEELTSDDVAWISEYPERALRLAAATEEKFSREWRLLEGEIIARLYPGKESARLGIEIAQ